MKSVLSMIQENENVDVDDVVIIQQQQNCVKEITVDAESTEDGSSWNMVPLYKENKLGKTLMWQVGFDGIENLIMTFGHVPGDVRTTITKVELNNSGRTLQEQALLEAKKRYIDKYREDNYRPIGSKIETTFKGMKGKVYIPNKTKLVFPVYVQRKLDGIRMLCSLSNNTNNEVVMKSYAGLLYTHIKHIPQQLQFLFTFLPPGVIIDGEMYNHSMSFHEITSSVRTTKTQHPRLKEIEYHIFDIYYEDTTNTHNWKRPFEERYARLQRAFVACKDFLNSEKNTSDNEQGSFCVSTCRDAGQSVDLERDIKHYSEIQTLCDDTMCHQTISTPCYNHIIGECLVLVNYDISHCVKDIISYHDKYVLEGYEGIMIKKISNGATSGPQFNTSLYKSGYSINILKFKLFIDEEAKIIDVKNCQGTEEGAARLIVEDIRGNIIPIRMRGSFEIRREWYKNKSLVVGKKLTIRYQELSSYGVPRFPVGIEIRDYE